MNINNTEYDGFFWSTSENAVHEWASAVYYDGERAYQRRANGQRIAATSFGAFGDDANNSRLCFERWLERAKAAYAALSVA